MANRDAILILFQDRRLLDESESLQHVSAEAKAITPLWLELIESAQEQGSVRADLDAATVAFGVYALLVASISKRHLGLEQAAGRPFEGDAVVDAAVTLLFDGITA
jgi:ribosomal protein S12 methylthiotransferase accessory factor YcaO